MQIDVLNTMNRAVTEFFVGAFGSYVGIFFSVAFNFLVGVLLTWALIMPFWCLWKLKHHDEEEGDQ